jgi:large subunit ribosomal protein L35
MPKIKTNRSAAKRFKKTKNGSYKRFKAGSRHLLTHKSPKRKRNLRTATGVDDADKARVTMMLPYG